MAERPKATVLKTVSMCAVAPFAPAVDGLGRRRTDRRRKGLRYLHHYQWLD
jgi:hypothetical protein